MIHTFQTIKRTGIKNPKHELLKGIKIINEKRVLAGKPPLRINKSYILLMQKRKDDKLKKERELQEKLIKKEEELLKRLEQKENSLAFNKEPEKASEENNNNEPVRGKTNDAAKPPAETETAEEEKPGKGIDLDRLKEETDKIKEKAERGEEEPKPAADKKNNKKMLIIGGIAAVIIIGIVIFFKFKN